jgi:hypothetical protein
MSIFAIKIMDTIQSQCSMPALQIENPAHETCFLRSTVIDWNSTLLLSHMYHPSLHALVHNIMAPQHGYPSSYRQGSGAPKASSSRQPEEGRPISWVQQEAHNASINYRSNTPHCFQWNLDEVVAVNLERDTTMDFEVVETTICRAH